MDGIVKKKVLGSAHSIAYFIHRARGQHLYRHFLRVCQDEHERMQVREEFKSDRKMSAADMKEAETILKRLQIARGVGVNHAKLVTPVGRSPIRPPTISQANSTPTANKGAESSVPDEIKTAAEKFSEPAQPIEWPWQRRS